MKYEQIGFWWPGCSSISKTDCYGCGCPDAGTGVCKKFYDLPERTITTKGGQTWQKEKQRKKQL